MFDADTSPFAGEQRKAGDRNAAWNAIKADPGSAALIAGLSMLANNNGRNSFGQLVGRAGFDTLAGLGSMEAQRQAQERYQQEQDVARAEAARKQQKDAWDMGMALNQYQLDRDKYQLDKQKQEAEMRGWEMLNPYMGGASFAGSGGASGAPTTDVPIWKKNNNPGNLRNVGGEGFQVFPTIEDGVRGMGRQLDLYFSRDGLSTVRGIVSKYAPPSENNTDAYVAKVAKDLGVNPDAPLNWDPVTRSKLISSMMHMETGQPWDAGQVGNVLSGGTFSAPSMGNPLAPPVIPESAKGMNPLAPGQVPDSVPRVQTQGAVPNMFGGVDKETLERVALLPGEAGAAARQILGMRKDAFGAQQPKIGDVSDLGKRWLSESQNFLAMMESANQLLASAKENSAAGDIGMIFTFMKALDPTSVVREGEQASAQNAAGVPERVRNVYNNMLTGHRLSPRQRKEFISLANSLVKSGMPEQERRNKYFTDLSNAYNISPSLVVRDLYPGLTDVIDSYLALPLEDEEPDDIPKEDIPGVSSVAGSAFAGSGAGGGGGGGVGAGTGGPMKDVSDDDLLTALGLK